MCIKLAYIRQTLSKVLEIPRLMNKISVCIRMITCEGDGTVDSHSGSHCVKTIFHDLKDDSRL